MNSTHSDALVRHKLQVHFDAHECRPRQQELEEMADRLDSLARQVGKFPVADARVLIEWIGRTGEYAVKLTLLLPGETLVVSDHDRVLHAAFDRALAGIEHSVKAYKERLDRVPERRRRAVGSDPGVTPAMLPDPAALDASAAAGDYPAFRTALAPYEEALRVRVGRWVERYPAVQGRVGKGIELVDVAEGVFLRAFEEHPRRAPEVPYGEWLESLIDPTVHAVAHDRGEEVDNIRMARSAYEATLPKV